MKTLVAGAAGFIGSTLPESLPSSTGAFIDRVMEVHSENSGSELVLAR
jgi:nucleoside-diphosphate-sugar epimerase